MSRGEPDRLVDLVGEAAALSPPDRRAFVSAAAAGPTERAEALSLLAALEHAGGFMEGPARDGAPSPVSLGLGPGAVVGRFELLRLIGEGGFGHVFLAEQREPVRRQVALKIIKPGMDSEGVVARFGTERQALAMMDHPAIAKVFDGGATDSGRPYFVMELVVGQPITDYCDQARMPVADRLSLFRDVCDAVQHAHQKGVIHRDLKPANVLVCERDGRACPKVIDFGIAKAVTQGSLDRAPGTEFLQFVGTPEYMSPEQTLGPRTDIDTRSDIYSLGVLLYELLTGTTPLDSRSLRSAGPVEMQRLIRETETPRPSTKLAAQGASAAERRRSDVEHLRVRLREDLDWIVLKALEKDRDRRYPTAAALADDVRRSLEHEPVEARPPGKLYRLRKFARRHRTPVIAASLAVVSLVAGVAAAGAGLISAIAERNRASEVKGFITSMLEGVTPAVARGDDTALMRRLLDAAAARLDSGEINDPRIDAELRHIVGSAYDQIGEYDPAERMLRRAVELRSRSFGSDDPSTLESLRQVGNVSFHQGRVSEAVATLRRAHAGLARAAGPRDAGTLGTLNDLGVALEKQGQYAEARDCFRDALDGFSATVGADDARTISAEFNLGFALASLGQYADAEPYMTRVLDRRRRTLGDDDPATVTTMSSVAALMGSMGRMERAEELLRLALPASRRVFGNDHPNTISIITSMGAMLSESGRAAEAEPYVREAMERSRRRLGDDHHDTLIAIANMAPALLALGKPDEAEAMLKEAIDGMRRSPAIGPLHPTTLLEITTYATFLRDRGRPAEAEVLAREAYHGFKRTAGPENPATLTAAHSLGLALRFQQKVAESEPLLHEAATGRIKALGPTHPRTLNSVVAHAAVLTQLGRYAQAEEELLASVRTAQPEGDGGPPPPSPLPGALAGLYDFWHDAEPQAGHDARAAAWRAKVAPPSQRP